MKLDYYKTFLTAAGLDAITNALQVILIVFVIGAAGFFVYRKFFRKPGKDASSNDDNVRKKGKILPAEEFVPVEQIRGGVVKLEGEQRYIASINCKGFDFFTSSEEEILSTQMAYYGFINTIQSPITMRIDSTAIDLTPQITNYKRIRQKRLEERDLKYSQFLEYRNQLKNHPDGPEREGIEDVLYGLSRQIEVLSKKINHLESLINYETRLSGRNANPVQEERYIIDWEFNPDDYPANITEAEITEKAEKALANKVSQMKHALAKANVKCTRDSDKELFQLNYRHFHPFGGDLYKSFEGSNAESRIVSGARDYEDARKRYEKALASDEWKAAEERIRAQQEAALAENNPDIDEDDEDDVLFGSSAGDEAKHRESRKGVSI